MSSPTPLKIRASKFTVNEVERENVNDPNLWFAKMFPESVQRFGPAFLQGAYDDADGLTRFIPVELNIDFFAHALGGDPKLAHRVVFYQPEETWYFYDPRLGCFCPTTETKLEALLSSYLMRCAQDAGSLVDIRRIVTEFRKPEILQSIIRRAKALHLADQSFFQSEKGQKRITVDGKVLEPTSKPSYELFVEKSLARTPASTITVTDAFHRYFSFCKQHQMTPLTRQEFKSLVTEVVREHFAVGLRNDVPGQNGKAQEGWHGLSLRLQDQSALGLS